MLPLHGTWHIYVGGFLSCITQQLLTNICRWCPLPRAELYDIYIHGVYHNEYACIGTYFLSMLIHFIFRLDHTCWPVVALLFAVFSLGALFDPARPPFSIESQEYYLLSRVAL